MTKVIIKLLLFSIISFHILNVNKLKALIPYYYFPEKENLEKESLSIGKTASQLLYFGYFKDGLNLAKIAVEINKSDAKLWTVLAEAQIKNKLYEDALISLNNAKKINSQIGEIYFAKSTIYLKQSKLNKAKLALKTGIKILPQNFNAIFQLGNIFLIEKNYQQAIQEFNKATKIKSNFWQAVNNKGLAYYELNKIDLSAKYFKKAIALEKNAEPMLALAACLNNQSINEAILLAKRALKLEPNYVSHDYRKEQLWGDKLQNSTKELFQNTQLTEEIKLAKTRINKNF